LILLSLVSFWFFFQSQKTHDRQAALQPFYEISNIPLGKPGDLIRFEPMRIAVPHGKAYRILYHSELADGTPTIVSGMVFIPDAKQDAKPGAEWYLVAWAHGTIGMGEQCAPSRSLYPLSNIGGLSEMLQAEFLVVATDYYGLGTEGIEHYLIGSDESRDVLNAVRAAKQFPQTATSNRFALWGHSQGGHAVLFSANLAKDYAPELELVAAAAAAPAVELPSLMQQEYKNAVPWVIGPEIAVAWPLVYKDLPLKRVLTNAALQNYQRLAYECTNTSGIEGIIRNKFSEQFFARDPNTNPIWAKALKEQTPKPVLGIPLLIVQGLADTIVIPNTTALYAQKSCDAGSNLTMDWLDDVTHIETAKIAGPSVASWLEDRFTGLPTEPTCDQPLPVAPAKEVQ
ncbi:MAG: alpha/beta fold hydrolase, partial [Candidatus Levybacteria bacterium]|nr:alpha/beta fold hydrolase [Candidatus Levybacteria bacterium]